MPKAARRARKREMYAPPRGLSRAQRLAIRTSKQWIAGYPTLVAEWHPTRNRDLFPYQLSHGSNVRVWWRCLKGPDHVWQARAAERVARGGRTARGCPFCDGKRFSVTNSLAARYPKLAKEWHPTQNDVSAKDVIATSGNVVWWKCAKGPDHEWRESIRHRTRTITHCPFCRGARLSITNAIATRFPDVAKQWHPTKNGTLTPRDVRAIDRRMVWWRCRAGPDHAWRATIAYRCNGGRCPFCVGTRLSVTNSLAAKYPGVAKEWHPTRNGRLEPQHVFPSSDRLVWWRCRRHHEWRAPPVRRAIVGTGCRECHYGH